MKRFIAALLMVLGGASAASASSYLNISSNTCWGAGGSNVANFACNTNTGSHVFYVSLVMEHAFAQVVGATTTLDVQVAGNALPPWWLTQPTGCRASAVFLDFNPGTMDGACPDVWGGNPPFSVVTVQSGFLAPYRLRITANASIPDDAAQDLAGDGTTELNVYRIALSHAKSTGTGACTGCTAGACITPTTLQLVNVGGDHDTVYGGSNAVSNWWITWNGGSGTGINACPHATPALNRTWGAVKSLYR